MAHSETKKQLMRKASAERRKNFRDAGLVQRSVWIREEDSEKFDAATVALTDHARVIAYLIGYDLGMTPRKIVEAIKEHELPYDIDDIRLLLTRGWLSDDPADDAKIKAALKKYSLPITIDQLR